MWSVYRTSKLKDLETSIETAEKVVELLDSRDYLASIGYDPITELVNIDVDNDAAEWIDFLQYDGVIELLSADPKTNGIITFGSLEGDNAGTFWGYEFVNGECTKLEGKLVFSPELTKETLQDMRAMNHGPAYKTIRTIRYPMTLSIRGNEKRAIAMRSGNFESWDDFIDTVLLRKDGEDPELNVYVQDIIPQQDGTLAIRWNYDWHEFEER